MASERAAVTTTGAHQGPEGQQERGRRQAVLADCRAMLKAIEGELARVDRRVEAATDPQESSRRVPAATETEGFVPMSGPRCTRVDLESRIVPKLERARGLLRAVLTEDCGRTWTEHS